jgi:hypothetical protein
MYKFTDGQRVIRKAYLSFQLRWPNKRTPPHRWISHNIEYYNMKSMIHCMCARIISKHYQIWPTIYKIEMYAYNHGYKQVYEKVRWPIISTWKILLHWSIFNYWLWPSSQTSWHKNQLVTPLPLSYFCNN